VHPPGVPARQQPVGEGARHALHHRSRRPAEPGRRAPDARQLPARQGLLDHDHAGTHAGRVVGRRVGHRRDHQGRAHRACVRRRDGDGHDRRRAGAPHPHGRPRAGAARRPLPRAEGARRLSMTEDAPAAGVDRGTDATTVEDARPDDAATPRAEPATEGVRRGVERLGIVAYTNVAPLHWRLRPWSTDSGAVEFVRGVPTELNAALLAGDIDLTLISSIEFVRHRHELRALPDFSISTLGPVYSVMLFHWRPWTELRGGRIAVTTDSATSVALLGVLLERDGLEADL